METSPFQILTDWQDKKGDKRFLKLGKDPDPAAPARHKPKKQKLDGKGSHGPGPGPGRPKSKNLQPKVQEYEFTDDPQDIPRTPKNDAPNRSAVKVLHNFPHFPYETMQSQCCWHVLLSCTYYNYFFHFLLDFGHLSSRTVLTSQMKRYACLKSF